MTENTEFNLDTLLPIPLPLPDYLAHWVQNMIMTERYEISLILASTVSISAISVFEKLPDELRYIGEVWFDVTRGLACSDSHMQMLLIGFGVYASIDQDQEAG